MHSLQLILSKKRYFAPVWVFTSLNIMAGTWALYVPTVKEKLALNDGELGIALFCYALGVIALLPIIPYITRKIGVGNATIIGILLFAVSFMLPLMASSYLYLCIALFIAGAMGGMTDIAMNALVSEIEKEDQVSFMSASHGFFSLGGVLSAGIGSLFITQFSSPVYHISLAALIVILTNLLLYKSYHKLTGAHHPKKEGSSRLTQFQPLFGLAIIGLVVMGSEGAVENWSKLYLLEVTAAPTEQIAGLGFILFSTTMTIGRFLGDRISQRLGSVKIIILGCLLSIVGYFGVLTTSLPLTIAGFGIIGLGLSVIIPELMRLAGNMEGISSSAGISFVSGVGFVGFLAGPVVLGLISNMAGLRMSFLVLLLLTVVAVLIAVFKDTRRAG